MKKAPQRLLEDFLQTLNSEGAGPAKEIIFIRLSRSILYYKDRKKENEYRLG